MMLFVGCGEKETMTIEEEPKTELSLVGCWKLNSAEFSENESNETTKLIDIDDETLDIFDEYLTYCLTTDDGGACVNYTYAVDEDNYMYVDSDDEEIMFSKYKYTLRNTEPYNILMLEATANEITSTYYFNETFCNVVEDK